MITFKAVIRQFDQHADKTGWTYIEIPENVAEEIKQVTVKPSGLKESWMTIL